MNRNQLKYFVAAAESRSFTKAADLQFVANSFYALRFCTPEGYTAMITFAHADNTVKSIDLYAPGM